MTGPSRFRRRTHTVTAEQFIPGQPLSLEIEREGGRDYVPTPSGKMRVDPGDWIVTDERGTRILIRPDLFPKMFEPLET